MRVFIAHFLIVLAAWSLFVKYLFPIAFALAYGEPAGAHVMWDLWPLVHLWLAWALLAGPAYTRWLAALTTAAELLIVFTKLTLFLADPAWDLWRAAWFVNKVFVAAVFVLLAGWLAAGGWRALASVGDEIRTRQPPGASGPRRPAR